jgi:ESS family glutamate:Na+ symporter
MEYWEPAWVQAALVLLALLATGNLLRAAIPVLARIGLPASILGGLIGLGLGPSGAGLLHFDTDVLEVIVYHGLAIVFIAGALQAGGGKGAGGERSFMLAIPVMVTLQAAVGLGTVLVLGLVLGSHLHPGFGLILPMGFEQGPGQAMSIGGAWEKGGMTIGAQVGLAVAAAGFGWSLAGIILIAWGRARGLLSVTEYRDDDAPDQHASDSQAHGPQLVSVIGVCYILTLGVVWALAQLTASLPDISAMAWGFHFIFGALVALAVRGVLVRANQAHVLDERMLGNVSSVTVEVMTTAALAAIQLAVLGDHLMVIVLVTTIGGLVTAAGCLWLARRAFREAPFEHAILWYGMSTGTLPVGLALLNIVDPKGRTPVKLDAVLGSALSVPFVAVPLLALMPIAVSGWAEGYPTAGWITVALLFAYAAVLLAIWVLVPFGEKARLRLTDPLSLWPPDEG